MAWAYCHVPNGWSGSALDAIESQVERFAPGFRECILGRAVSGTEAMQAWNENLVGGDINGGSVSGLQFFFRPTWRQYATPSPRVVPVLVLHAPGRRCPWDVRLLGRPVGTQVLQAL